MSIPRNVVRPSSHCRCRKGATRLESDSKSCRFQYSKGFRGPQPCVLPARKHPTLLAHCPSCADYRHRRQLSCRSSYHRVLRRIYLRSFLSISGFRSYSETCLPWARLTPLTLSQTRHLSLVPELPALRFAFWLNLSRTSRRLSH